MSDEQRARTRVGRLRVLLSIVASRMSFALYVRRRYRWREVTAVMAEPPPLPAGLVLAKAGTDDLCDLESLGSSFSRSREWLEAGHDLWVVRDGARTVGSSWVFHGMAPTDTAASGWIPLQQRMVNVEDQLVDPDYRRRGIATASRQQILKQLFDSGEVERAICCVLTDNLPSLRAGDKVGFRDFAIVDVKTVGLIRRGRNWRDRIVYSNRLSLRHVRVEAPEVASVAVSPCATELRGWLISELTRR